MHSALEHRRHTTSTQLVLLTKCQYPLPPGRGPYLDAAYAAGLIGTKQLQHLPHTDAHAGQAMQDGAGKPHTLADLRVYVQRVVVT